MRILINAEKQKPDMEKQAENDAVSLELDGAVLDYTYSIFYSTAVMLLGSLLNATSWTHEYFNAFYLLDRHPTQLDKGANGGRGGDDKDCDV